MTKHEYVETLINHSVGADPVIRSAIRIVIETFLNQIKKEGTINE